MHVVSFSKLNELRPHADAWDWLALGNPFRSWAWLSTWWKHYRRGRRGRWDLLVLGVFDDRNVLIGLAPWYVEKSPAHGRVVRPLGTGEVCSDYLGVLAAPGREALVAGALARWLVAERMTPSRDSTDAGQTRWDRLELIHFDATDPCSKQLVRALEMSGCLVRCVEGSRCWRAALPATLDDYVARLSKNSRKRFRQFYRRMIQSGRARLRSVGTLEELTPAMDRLIDLHQRRRASLGQPGCFASTRFAAFHREVAAKMLRAGQLQLHLLDVDGRTIAAEYQFSGNGVLYAYQGGWDPAVAALQPGRIATVATIDWAIRNGYRAYDLMRGDEAYKMHWGVRPCPSIEIHVAPRSPIARLRHAVWWVGHAAKNWIKHSWQVSGHVSSDRDHEIFQ